mgnify:FL=1
MQLASSSGDCTVKVWSFEKARCVQTFVDHTQVQTLQETDDLMTGFRISFCG